MAWFAGALELSNHEGDESGLVAVLVGGYHWEWDAGDSGLDPLVLSPWHFSASWDADLDVADESAVDSS